MTEATANVGVIGMAVMGSNLARNLASRPGNTVAIFNRTAARTHEVAAAHPEAGFVVTDTMDDFVASLVRPRVAIIMVQAGAATDAVIAQLADRFEPGDIIVDAGNTYFRDTIARDKLLAEKGLEFAGVGVSGGEEGALHGPSIMPGGSAAAYDRLGPLLESIAAVAPDGTPCVTHVGTDGAGHFVKMVHNGIEYSDMQLIAEAYDLLRHGAGLAPDQIAAVFDDWNKGELESYLVEITAAVLRKRDEATGAPLVDVIVDAAGQKGTGTWTVQTALELGIPVSGIAEAVFARALSSQAAQRAAARNLPGPILERAPLTTGAGESIDGALPDAVTQFIDDVRLALFASKIVAYSQGFDVIRAGAAQFGWSIDFGAIARIWRAGCIIRAGFLGRIADAYAAQPDLEALVLAPYFTDVMDRAQGAWRRAASEAIERGIPAPGFTSALAYYDGLRAGRLPAALIQGQRDFFGAHTYQRIDRPGTFHTDWSGDGQEHEV